MKASIRLLLIEDNPGDARLVKEALAESGEHQYILTQVPDLATGLAQIASHPLDAILLDLGLPDSTGIDTFEKVYTQAPGIPVILLTGLVDDTLASKVVRLGAQDYLVKGEITDRALKRVIRYAIERKRSEDSLRKSESLKAAILESALDCMITIDHLGRIMEFNPAAQATFGYSLNEVLGKEMVELIIPPSLRERHRRGWERYFATGESNILGKRLELTGMRADGSEFPVELTIARVTDSNPSIFTGFLRDITDRKRAEEDLHKLNEELEQRVAHRTAQLEVANRELEAFSYSVSHDLRAPLRRIDGFSQALLDDYGQHLPVEGHGYLERVRNASQHMATLIDDLLKLARVTRTGMNVVSVDLSKLAEGIAIELQSTQPERKVKFIITPKLEARGDAPLLRVVLQNLLNNAWKYTSKLEQAEIEFGSKRENNETVYFIRDNGAGFDMAYAGKLFGAFQRLHELTEFPGTGVGLATVQRIVHRHGGRIWAEAEVNRGATFFFTLP